MCCLYALHLALQVQVILFEWLCDCLSVFLTVCVAKCVALFLHMKEVCELIHSKLFEWVEMGVLKYALADQSTTYNKFSREILKKNEVNLNISYEKSEILKFCALHQ